MFSRCIRSSLKTTLVTAEHVSSGGKLVDFGGYGMPVQYEGTGQRHALSIIDSSLWTRSSCSLFDVSHMCSIFWRGKDAPSFLERVTVMDVEEALPNMGSLSVIPTASGGILDDTMITRLEDAFYMVVNCGNATGDIEHFKKHMADFDDVQMEVRWDDRGLFALQGPKASYGLN